jgi:DNA-binding MarR family transcriptional regulator
MSNADRSASGGPASLAAFFADLVRAETRLYNALGDRLRERHGIVASQFEFLRYVRDHPGARVADVAAQFVIGVGAASKGADRLERQGWVARQANPADRRSSLLALTDEGSRLVDAAEGTFGEVLDELIGDVISPSEAVAVGQVLGKLRAGLEGKNVGAPAG